MQERFRKIGSEVVTMDQAGFRDYATDEAKRWREVATTNHITAQD